jgi:glycosyltransferase involved in cell wall biosynthesis
MTPSLSIVIPTHKRADVLRQCLERIEKQTIAKQLEVIVIHDGESAETRSMIEQSSFQLSAFSFQEIPKSQQGIARNRGVGKVTSPIVLFGQDDIFLAPDACEKHLAAHQKGQHAVLGFTTWDPACGITPVMTWLEKSGWQFHYPAIAKYAHGFIPSAIQHRFTYTSHISVPSDIAKKFPFREDVSLYGWEDILWGTKLRDAGVPLYYEPDAKALHHHHIELADSIKRLETIGQSITHMAKIDPTFDRIPRGGNYLKHWLMSWLPGFRGAHERAFLRGMAN